MISEVGGALRPELAWQGHRVEMTQGCVSNSPSVKVRSYVVWDRPGIISTLVYFLLL